MPFRFHLHEFFFLFDLNAIELFRTFSSVLGRQQEEENQFTNINVAVYITSNKFCSWESLQSQ